jgi:diacylglycerol kinase (ATP)
MIDPVPPPDTYKNTGFTRIIKAGGYSLQGLRATWQGEAAFRQECLLLLLVIPTIVFLDLSATERSLLVIVTILVLIVELLNSAIEAVVDRVGSEHNVLSGRAKDMGSAAVLLSLLLWFYVWVEILINA